MRVPENSPSSRLRSTQHEIQRFYLRLAAEMRCPAKRKFWWRRVRISAAQLGAAKVYKPKIRQNAPNSYDISKGFFQLGICEFESSVVSQPVAQLEIVGYRIRQVPANCGLL